MTHVILVIGAMPQGVVMIDDPRTSYELVKIVNTGRLIISLDKVERGKPVSQRALALHSWSALAVLTTPPPPRLTESNYDMIFGLSKGLTIDQIAVQSRVSRRLVCSNLAYLKMRFDVATREEILMRAVELGIL